MESIMKFGLLNNEGCLMASVEAKSFREAREIFAQSYEGKYKIINLSDGAEKNVILK